MKTCGHFQLFSAIFCPNWDCQMQVSHLKCISINSGIHSPATAFSCNAFRVFRENPRFVVLGQKGRRRRSCSYGCYLVEIREQKRKNICFTQPFSLPWRKQTTAKTLRSQNSNQVANRWIQSYYFNLNVVHFEIAYFERHEFLYSRVRDGRPPQIKVTLVKIW